MAMTAAHQVDTQTGAAGFDALAVSGQRTIARLRWGAAALALLIAFALPLGRVQSAWSARMSEMSVAAAELADQLSITASTQPDRWIYERNALDRDMRSQVRRGFADAARLLDERGRVVAVAGDWSSHWALSRSAEVLDSGLPVATLQLQTRPSSLLITAIPAALLGALLGAAVWWLVARIALRSLTQTLQALAAARDAAERAGQARATFLATMSHEIRTPMNGVIGMTSLLLETPLSDMQRHYAEVIRRSGDALLAVINDILEFSKTESGHVILEPQVFCAESLAEDVLALLGPAAAPKRIDLLCQVVEGTPAWLMADATRLRQVLVNVVGNAVKFTEHGEVLVTIDGTTPGRLRYTVRDSGIGMTPAQLQAIFKPFVQADASTTRRYGGTGLGLAISRKLVTLMGGTLTVDSQLGQGATFVVEIDVTLAEAPAHDSGTVDLRVLSGKRVLLVDDNPVNLEIVQAWACRWAMRPQIADCADAALAAFGNGSTFDLALVDFNMPGVDGAGLARRIKQLRPDLPIVLLSSSDGGPDGAALFAARFSKPVRRVLLLQGLLKLFAPAAAGQAALTATAVRAARAAGTSITADTTLTPAHATAAADSAAAVVSIGAAASSTATATATATARATGATAATTPAAAAVTPAVSHALGHNDAPQGDDNLPTVLVVEDNAVNAMVVRAMLEQLGLRSEHAESGTEAIVAVERQRYDLVFMDMLMPGMDGVEATRRIRTLHLAEQPYIVALTANAMTEDRLVCADAGMNAFMAKPVRLEDIEQCLLALPCRSARGSRPAHDLGHLTGVADETSGRG